MDALDTRIIRELTGPDGSYQWNVRQSLSKIARKLEVDEETIRRRIKRVGDSGLLKGSELIVNPYLLSREPVRMLLKTPYSEESKRSAISQIQLVDGVLLIVDMHGDTLQVLMFCESEEAVSRRTKLISSILDAKDPIILRNLEGLGFLHPNTKVQKTDWLILKSMRKDPRKSAQQVAKEIDVSKRTVERRINVMVENNAFFHMFNLDFRKSDGVTCSTIVSYKDQRTKARLDKIIEARLVRIIFSATAANMVSQFNFVCHNVAETESTVNWIRELDGVSKASLGIVKEYILVSDWLDNEIERMIANHQ